MKIEKQEDGTVKWVLDDTQKSEEVGFFRGGVKKEQAASDLKHTKLDDAKKRLEELNLKETAKE